MVNIAGIFDLGDDLRGPREEQHVANKQHVMKGAKKIGQVQKRLDPLNQWENYFCILSGSHLYFYKDAQQNMPASHFYIKGASILENNPEVSLTHNITLKNRFGVCCIAASNLS